MASAQKPQDPNTSVPTTPEKEGAKEGTEDVIMEPENQEVVVTPPLRLRKKEIFQT